MLSAHCFLTSPLCFPVEIKTFDRGRKSQCPARFGKLCTPGTAGRISRVSLCIFFLLRLCLHWHFFLFLPVSSCVKWLLLCMFWQAKRDPPGLYRLLQFDDWRCCMRRLTWSKKAHTTGNGRRESVLAHCYIRSPFLRVYFFKGRQKTFYLAALNLGGRRSKLQFCHQQAVLQESGPGLRLKWSHSDVVSFGSDDWA